jgi:hypothetical protein
MTDTVSAKTDTIVLRNPRYGLSLAGIDMNRARKKPLLALLRRQIFSGTGCGTLQVLKTLLLPERHSISPSDIDIKT